MAFFLRSLKDVVGCGFPFFGFFRIAVMRWDVSGIGHKAGFFILMACVNDMFYIFTSLFFHQRLLV